MARPGTENHGTARHVKNLDTEKYWHGMARKHIINMFFLFFMFFGRTTSEIFLKSQIPLLAIHKIISHLWEDGSRKVNNDEPDLRFSYGHF